jgi:hypothetical protein
MPTIETCGGDARRTAFTYRGSVPDGIVLEFESPVEIRAESLRAVIEQFRGRVVPGGFSRTDPTPGSVGEFLDRLPGNLTSGHASFVCAVLRHEGYVQCALEGNTVIVTFNV